MTIQYLPKGAKHTDKPTVIKNVIEIKQVDSGVVVCIEMENTNNKYTLIENGIEFLTMPEKQGWNCYDN